jgi:tripartite-type tricarboxylate transporter receptor subunit TctC
MQMALRGLLVAACAFGIASARPAHAQHWPEKPIRLIVTTAAGGGTDTIVRIYAPRLGDALGQPVVIENRPSAGGIVAMEAVARAAPDGYTLLASPGGNIVVGPHLYHFDVDVEKDLVPVAPTAHTTLLLVVRAGLPVHSVSELVSYAKAHPGKLNFGSTGNGTLPHIAAEMLLHAAKIQATHIPYKGVSQAVVALVGNEIDFTFDPGVAIPSIKAGKLRLLAVAGAARSSNFPQTPTMAEAGVDVNGTIAQGVYAPAGTPHAIVGRVHDEISRIMQTAEVRAALARFGAEPEVTDSPEQFAAQLRSARKRFGAILREANIHRK